MAYGNGRWVITGRSGGIFVSTDGVTWIDHSLSDITQNLTQVIFHNGEFLAYLGYPNTVGELAYRSTDGVGWTTVDLIGALGLRSSILLRNGQYIGFDGAGSVLVSDNGIDWISKDAGFPQSVSRVLYEKGRYVFFGNGITDKIYITTDLESWETITVPEAYHHISYRDGWFLLRDGNWKISWVSRDIRNWKEAKDIPSIDSSFNLTGEFDLSADGESVTVKLGSMDLFVSDLSNPNADLTMEVMDTREPECFGHVGKSYQLEGSNDFTNWFAVGDPQQGSGKFLAWPPIDPAGPYVYYRIAEQ